jgi:hypothetical protein
MEKEYIEILRPCLHFQGIQIKSPEAFRTFAAAVDVIEGTAGIHSCRISMEEIFVCPDIVFGEIESPTPMEKLLIELIESMACKGRDL